MEFFPHSERTNQVRAGAFCTRPFCCKLRHCMTPTVTPYAVISGGVHMVGLAARLKQLRTTKGLTQQQAAEAVGVTRSVISGYETEMRYPSLDILVSLAHLYGVTTDYLLCMDNRKSIDVSGLNKDEIATISHMVDLLRTKKQ